MRKEDYIAELKSRLRGVEQSDIEDAVAYCEEYFDEAEDEEQAIKELGSPAKFAAQIKTEAAFRTTKNPNNYRKPHSMMKSILMILGGICALPIALPLLLVAVLLIIVFGMVICILVFAGGLAMISFFYAAIVTLVGSFYYAQGSADLLFQMGSAFVLLGIAILLCLLVIKTIRFCTLLFVTKISEFYDRHKKGGHAYEN